MLTLTKSNTEYESYWTTQKPLGGFTVDDLIDAYCKGAHDYELKTKKELERRFTNNLTVAQNFGAKFIESMKIKGIDIKYAKLKFTTIDNFKLLFFVSKKLFVSDKILDLYNELTTVLFKLNSEKFELTFNVMPYSNKVNEQRILADGYFFTYGKHK